MKRLLASALTGFSLGLNAEPLQQQAELPDLLVTGSRVGSGGGNLERPVSVIDRRSLEQSGAQSLAGLLQSLPYFSGAPLNGSVAARDQGGGFSRGIDTLELRGLGGARTLVLLNGRRVPAGGNGTAGLVDLASMPLAMIERVEVLRAAASVEYGADAVAGVVNIVTQSDFEGWQTQLKSGLSEQGDGEFVDASLVFGQRKPNAHILAGLQFFDQTAVSKGDREFSSQLLTLDDNNQIIADGSSAPPQGNYATSSGRLTLIDGESGDGAEDFRPFVNRGADNDRFNFNPFEDLQQDAQRLSAFAISKMPLDDAHDYFAELQWQRRESNTRLAPLPLFTNRLDGVSVAANQVYNPFGEDLTDVRRRMIEAGTREFEQSSESWRILSGVEGQLGALTWDFSLAYGRNKVRQDQTGDFLRDRLRLALGPSFDDSGTQRCGQVDQVVADCVPLNLFGGPGSVSVDMLDYLASSDLRDTLENDQRLVNLNLRRSVTGLPAGDLNFAGGYEYRQQRASDIPDLQTQAGNTTGAARARTSGSYDSHEAYLEIAVPLLNQQWGLEAATLDLGWRGVDFSNFDFEQVWELGLQLEPVSDVKLYWATSRAFRAPSIAELFGGQVQANPAIDDPCADFSSLDAAARQRCVDQGVPADGSFDQSGNETPELRGGNRLLKPEISRSQFVGLFWQLNAALSLRLDYYDIEIDDGISALGANTLLSECIHSGIQNFCERIERDSSGAITQVVSTTQNLTQETAKGVDFELRFKHKLADQALRHNLMLNRVLERDLIAFSGAQPFLGVGEYDADKFGAIPRWQGRYQMTWQNGAWSASYALQWIGDLRERGGEVAAGTSRRVSERVYHDLTVGLNWGNGLATRIGVENLTDSQPPFLANADQANTDVATYRLLGRRYWLSMNYVF